MSTDHWPYILAALALLCATAIIGLAIETNKVIPETIVTPAVLIITGIFSYLYGIRKDGINGRNNKPGP